jgi:type IV pilus biogenesis protein CpaD/CtpE
MNLKKHLNLPVTSIILTSALLVGLNGCRSTAQLIPESVIVRDTVIVTKERTLTDTLLLYKDTTIYQDRVKLKVDFIDRFVKVKVDCPSDTVRINTIKIVSQKEPLQKKNQFTESTKSLSVLFIIIFAGLLIINLAKRLS